MCTTWLKHKIIIEDWDNVIFIARSICKAMLTKKWDINNWKVKVNKKFIQKEKLCWINFNWHLTKYNFEQISFSWDVACYFPYIFGSAFDNKLGSTSYSVNPPPDPLLGWGEGGDSPTKFLKREVAWQDLNFERGLLEKTGGGFSRDEGCSFFIKSKLKSKIFNDKKLHQQKYFSLT